MREGAMRGIVGELRALHARTKMSDTFAAMMRASITAISAAQACQRDLRALASLVKDDASPVTVADFVVQTIVRRRAANADALACGSWSKCSAMPWKRAQCRERA